jgi:Mn2+/Fe2+ NRAMP family transporter
MYPESTSAKDKVRRYIRMNQTSRLKNLLKVIGPGLLFASNAIGTSHLILSTRAGAHHGMVFLWIIFAALLLKYPFFEFAVRFTNATGKHILHGYKELGNWAVTLFLFVIFIAMFAVTGAIGAVCAGLLSTFFGWSGISMPLMVGGILAITSAILLIGKYSILDQLIKFISIVLFITISVSFLAVMYKGPIPSEEAIINANEIWKGAGLALTVSLIGFMPTGLEVSAMHSIWSVEKIRQTRYYPTLKESLFDFNLGYMFTSILAFMFMTIGAFTIYGSGQLIEGNSIEFSNRLLEVFSSNLGSWSRWFIKIAAFGTIYGTLIVSMDAFTRSFVLGTFTLIKSKDGETKEANSNQFYTLVLIIIAIGGFLLFIQFPGGMIKILEAATICIFLLAPIIAYLNLKLITRSSIPTTHKPKKRMLVLAYVGLFTGIGFTVFYIYTLAT